MFPFCPANSCNQQKRARGNIAAARRRYEHIGELRARLRGGKGVRQTTAHLVELSPLDTLAVEDIYPLDEEESQSGVEEEQGRGLVRMPSESRLNPVATCREESTSAWLHFPHIELVFLFFAYGGAVASFASAMRNAQCSETFYTAAVAMVRA